MGKGKSRGKRTIARLRWNGIRGIVESLERRMLLATFSPHGLGDRSLSQQAAITAMALTRLKLPLIICPHAADVGLTADVSQPHRHRSIHR